LILYFLFSIFYPRQQRTTMRLLLNILRWLLIGGVVLVLLAGGGGYLWLRGALPQTSGTIKVQGPNAPVEILRDVDGVPHIYAKTESDALFGLGYAHAQDRLWQMEFQRRIGNGRLSEVLGEATLSTDKFLRTLGPARAAASAWAKATPAERKVIEYYVAGVNAFISTHHGRQLPVEFSILGFAPEPWRPEDVLVWGKMMAWDLGDNWDKELLRAKLIARLGPDKAAQLMPAYAAGGPLILPDSPTADHRPPTTDHRLVDAIRNTLDARRNTLDARRNTLDARRNTQYDGLLAINRTIEDTLGLGGTVIGSNNWVVGGARTTTGKPLLANDPHLGAQVPSIWYLAHLSGGRLDAIGATLPGVPGIIIGHNQQIAWGVTNTAPDVQDLYVEHVNDRDQAEYKGAWEPMRVIPEVIKVKGQPDLTIRVRVTRHGPLISDVLEDAGEPLAFRWTALDDEDHTIEAFNGIARARNWQQFTNALARYKAPMQNFVYADTDNNIGYYAPGALPIRPKGDGTLPAPGWTGEYDWAGYVPFDQLPHAYNPPQGFIVSANNKVAPDSYPYFIGSNFAAPYRAARIVELIQSKDKHSPDDMAAIQADVRSSQARELLPYLLQAQPTDERSKAVIELLRGWDGTIAGDSARATIYEAWYQQLPARIFADELGEQLWDDYAGEKDMIAMMIPSVLNGTGGDWCDDIRTPQHEDCTATSSAALSESLAEMAKYQGSDDFRSWRWDRVHRAVFPHNPFDNVGALKSIFSRSIANGGDDFTIDVAPIRRTERYNQYHVPSYRQIIDLADLGASRFMHTTGQSGQVLSGHYADLIERWQRVAYMPMRYDKEAINAAAAARLVLEP
jgi:penicillin G amidase